MKIATMVFLVAVLAGMAVAYTHFNEEEHLDMYVAIDGDDEQEGTFERPLRTLKQAASLAKAGTTVHIREGTYREKLIVQHSGLKSRPVVFKPFQNEKVILSGENLTSGEGETSLITIHDKNYVTVSGFIIQNLSTASAEETVIGIFVTGSSSHILLDKNHIRRIETHSDDGNGHGIAVYGAGPMEDIVIANNTIEDLKLGSSEALVLNGNIDGFEISNNLVRRSDNIGIDLIGYEGIASNKNRDFVRNGIVSGNKIHDISAYDNPAYQKEYSAGGIYVDGGKDIVIKENTIYQSDIGIEATSEHPGKFAENIEIINNEIYDNFYTGISIGGYDEQRGGTKNSRISKNILYRNDTKGIGGGQLLIQHDAKANKIEKNILTAGPSRIFIANYFKPGGDNEFNQNVFHKENKEKGIWIWANQEFTSFSSFQSVSGSGEKTMYVDPKYVDSKAYDFRFKTDSPIKGIFE